MYLRKWTAIAFFLMQSVSMVAYPATSVDIWATYNTTTGPGGGVVITNPKPLTPYGGTWVTDNIPSINSYSWVWRSGPISVTDDPAYHAYNWRHTAGIYINTSTTQPTFSIQIVDDGYVPVQGAYRWLALVCSEMSCNKNNKLATSTSTIFTLNTTQPISMQATRGEARLAYANNQELLKTFCVALEHVDSGTMYGTGKLLSCSDGQPLVGSVSCAINGGQTLDVFLGDNIDRTQIGTQPGGYGGTTKSVNVNCTGPAGSQLTASAALSFTPVAGSGAAHISTSNPGLGVVTKLEGNVMTNTTGTPVNLIIGSNQLQMEFTPVRLDTTPIESVATGPFSASASLILTWQ